MSGIYSPPQRLQLINAITISSPVAQVDFTDFSEFDTLLVVCKNLTASVASLRSIRVSTDGGATFLSAGYDFVLEDGTLSASSTISMHGSNATAARSGIARLNGINSGDVKAFETINRTAFGGGFMTITDPINAIRVFNAAGGNLTAGLIELYGS